MAFFITKNLQKDCVAFYLYVLMKGVIKNFSTLRLPTLCGLDLLIPKSSLWASSCNMKVSFGDPDSLISLSPAEGSLLGPTPIVTFGTMVANKKEELQLATWMKEPRWKCRHFRWARLQGASLASLIISWRWPIEWYQPRLTKITPSPTRAARPRRLRSRRRDGFWRRRAGNVAIFDGRGFRGRPWHL